MASQNQPEKPKQQIDPASLSKLLQTQHQTALNQAEQLKIKQKEVDHQAAYAQQLLKYQAEHIKSIPSENRKTYTRIGWIVGLGGFLIMGFLTFWLYIVQTEFAKSFLHGLSYLATSALSFWVGRKASKRNEKAAHDDEPEDAKVVD